MMKYLKNLFFLSLFLLVSFCTREEETVHPVEAYLAETHSAYEYDLQKTITGDQYTAYVVRMVSQEWLTPDEVDKPEWWHWLTIIVPDTVEHTTGLLWIGGGSVNTALPEEVDPVVLNAALATRSVTANLHNVPFQPLSFTGDERLETRTEDELIAYGWRQYLEGGARDEDAVWLSRLPMTAAAQRAMDTISEFTETQEGHTVDSYVVSGASKRGWTTWTTGIFDERVVAIAPVVIDLLNVIPSFQHHWQAYGEWSPAISEYVDEQIMDWQFSTEFSRMLELADPYSYLDRLTMPKYIINAASDEFFLPDSWQFYWDDLLGENHLRYVPNAGHSLRNTDAGTTLASFYNHILTGEEIPSFEWDVEENGFRIRLDPDQLPDQLLLWNAHNPEGRDFRLYVIDRIWLSRNVDIPDNGEVFVEIDTPDTGFTAWFAEATYHNDTPLPFKQTTGVVVTPDEYPYPPFEPDPSLGTIPEE